MRKLLVLPWLSLLFVAAAHGSPGAAGNSFDRQHEEPVRRAYIPSDDRVHGELRLLRRGDSWVLQTALWSKRLRRGVQRIDKKERYYWRPENEGYADSERYRQDLARAKQLVVEAFEDGAEENDDPRQQLLIEFVLGPCDGKRCEASYALYAVELEEGDEGWAIQRATPIVERAASSAYVRRAMRIQAEEGFGEVPAEIGGALDVE